MFDKECVPFAPVLIESMRSLGYSFKTAIADLIDNSVSAEASYVDIIAESGVEPKLFIIDDGCGMTKDELYEAMRYGSQNPLIERNEKDLGRFGLGMKAASLSQCRKLIVISKKNGEICGYSWDLDYIIKKESWMLKGYSKEEIDNLPNIDILYKMEHGTYIYLSSFDRIKESSDDISKTFNRMLSDMMDHLSLVFHRFLEKGLKIVVNNCELIAKDPFLRDHRATQQKRECAFYIDGEKIILKPFILPHFNKLKGDDLDKVGGREKLRNEQGFYVYRNKRLIIWGTWFRLERKDELSKLARVMVDIPNSLDSIWSIDIKKSKAVLPDIIKKNMYNAVYDSILSSEKVYKYRGRKEKNNSDVEFVWERLLRKNRDGYEYKINRKLPQLELLESELDEKQLKLLDNALDIIEKSLPVNTLYLDVAKGKAEEKDINANDDVEKIWNDILYNIEYVKSIKGDVLGCYKAFLKTEPYCYNAEIKERIKREVSKYE